MKLAGMRESSQGGCGDTAANGERFSFQRWAKVDEVQESSRRPGTFDALLRWRTCPASRDPDTVNRSDEG